MREFFSRNGYQILILSLAAFFLIDSSIGENYSHENLHAYMATLFFILVSWLHLILRAVQERTSDVHVYLSPEMDDDKVIEVIKKAVDKSRRLR